MRSHELAEVLFQRQEPAIRDCISRADCEQRRWFVKRILSLHSDAGQRFVGVDLREFAKSSGLITTKDRFASLLKKREEEDLNSRARRTSANRPIPEMYYFPQGKNTFFWRCSENAFTSGGKNEALEELRRLGFTKLVLPGSHLPEDRALISTLINRPIGYAGGIAGLNAGIHNINGKAILVTSSPKLIAPAAGEFPVIMEFLRSRLDFGRQADPGVQTSILLDWASLSVKTLHAGGRHRPAQVLALIGRRRTGKDVLANDIIAPLLGGRVAKPMAKFKGETRFTADLVASEMWHISDELDSVSPKTKAALEEALKQTAVSPSLQLEAKFEGAESVPTFRRLVITCNDDHTSMEYFPSLRENFADKLIMLDVQGLPFFGHDTPFENFAEWKAAVTGELPAFVRYLLHEHVIDSSRACTHYGVQSYINPYLRGVLLEQNPGTALHEIISNSGLWEGAFPVEYSDGRRVVMTTAIELLEYLGNSNPGALGWLGIRASNHFGRLMAGLIADRSEYYHRLPPLHGITRYQLVEPEGSRARAERERMALAGFS
jgi:hypothetical protein